MLARAQPLARQSRGAAAPANKKYTSDAKRNNGFVVGHLKQAPLPAAPCNGIIVAIEIEGVGAIWACLGRPDPMRLEKNSIDE